MLALANPAMAYEDLIQKMQAGEQVSQQALEQFAQAAMSGSYDLPAQLAVEAGQQLRRYGYSEAGQKMVTDNVERIAPRYDGAQAIVFDENDQDYAYQDPPGGRDFQKIVTSCFYKSSVPRSASAPRGESVTLLEPPEPVTARRMIWQPKNEHLYPKYRFYKMAIPFNANAQSGDRFTALFYGSKLQTRHVNDGPNENVTREVVEEVRDPAWHSFNCDPRVIRY